VVHVTKNHLSPSCFVISLRGDRSSHLLGTAAPVAADGLGARGLPGTGGLNAVVATSQLEIHVQEPTGAPVEGVAVVTLTNLGGQFYRQGTTKAGYITFNNVAPTEYTVQVVAPAYERALKQVEASENHSTRVVVVLQRGSGDTALAAQLASINPKAQKELAVLGR
jgi:hypothetical protein